MQKLISIDIKADFGMLKKPDTNEPVYLTFNMLHKPAFLGILGAIIGLEGFKEKGKLPEYYKELKDLQIGIQPLEHENGNFQKTIIQYNNTTGTASKEQGGNLIVTEQTLIAPAFRCYLLLDIENELHQKLDKNLKNGYAEYLPYLGKNEFSVWWEGYQEYKYSPFEVREKFKIKSIFIKEETVKDGKLIPVFMPFMDVTGDTYSYFERLPVGYDEDLLQYSYEDFAFTDWTLRQTYNTGNYLLLKINTGEIIQVF